MLKNFIHEVQNCEICGSSKTLLIQERISWNNNMFGVLPVHCCSDCGFFTKILDFQKILYGIL